MDLNASEYFLFDDLKEMFKGKNFAANEELIAKAEGYFENKGKSFHVK